MSQEHVLQDFSGGMNASVAVDKLDDKECLLAESVRFDEAGNVLISGANTAQNSVAISDGTSSNVHSLFFDSAIGCVAGVGTDIWFGVDPAHLSDLSSVNSTSAKMSFGAATNRVYMDINAVGYFKDTRISSLVTVDWAPPSATSAVTTGPNTASGLTTSGGTFTATGFGFSLGTQNMQGAQSTFTVLSTYTNTSTTTILVTTETCVASLLVGGVPAGTSTSQTQVFLIQPATLTTNTTVYTFGNANYLWGSPSLTPTQVNASNFGFRLGVIGPSELQGFSLTSDKCTVYQSASGFVAVTGAAGNLSGTYTWKVSFTAVGGEESDASSASASIVLASQQGTLTAIPTGDARSAGRNIYRKGGSLTSYYLVGSIPDNSSTTFADNVTDLSALATAVILPGDTIGDEPNSRLGNQAVRYPCLHYERTFWASGNTLIWSKPLNGFAYPVDFSTPVGDSKVITGIVSQGGELIVFKPDSIWRLTGTDENSFQLARTLSPVGSEWPFSIVFAGGSTSGFYFTGRILFANRQGIWAFNGYSSNKISSKLDLWFRQDDRTNVSLFGANGFHSPEIVSAAATAGFQGAASASFYRLAYAEAGHTSNNAMLVLDLERGNISKRSFSAPCMAVDPVSGYFYAGSSSGVIVKLDDWNATNSGLGGAVNFDFQTKYNDLELRGSKFAVWGIEFLINTSGQTVTPSVYFDEGTGTAETLGTISVSQATRVFRKLAGASSRSCRNFSIRLNCSSSAVNTTGKPSVQLNHLKIYYEPRQARARTGEG